MTQMKVTPNNIIDIIAFILFSDQVSPTALERKYDLFYIMSNYSKVQKKKNQHFVTVPSIRSWILSNNRSVPRRASAFEFLYDFINAHITAYSKLTNEKAVYFNELMNFFSSLGFQKILIATSDHDVGVSSIRRGKALVGNYQLIRPYVGRPERYIAEPVCIKIDNDKNNIQFAMYSHNQLDRKYIYSGDLVVAARYASALITRRHELYDNASSIRNVMLYISQSSVETEAHQLPCVAGLMMRGVKGESGAHGPVSLPFVMIRLSEEKDEIFDPQFTFLHQSLYRVKRWSHLLVGEITPTHGEIYKICERVVPGIQKNPRQSDVMQVRSPSDVAELIVSDATSLNAYEICWRDAVESYFRTYDAQRGIWGS